MPENTPSSSLDCQNQEVKKPRFNLYTWLFDNPERFFWVIVSLGVLGGLAALMVPNCIDWQISSNNSAEPKADEIRQKSISDLRLHILYITGGIIAILTLLQNSWKNQIDRRKIEDDIQKNKKDHNRQVHAERRSRYTKAVEQLANEKAAVRLGGIYTLVGLVDEWLADDNLDQDKQKEEGQVIINNLCSYIRSPFLIAEKLEEYEARKELNALDEFEAIVSPEDGSPRFQALYKRFIDSNGYKEPEDLTAGYAELREEQDVRRAIFVEMSKRSSTISTSNNSKVAEIKPGTWSKFDFNFSRAPIFYPLNNITIEEANFFSANFYGDIDFSDTRFIKDANFMRAKFTPEVNFSGATFFQGTSFIWTKFEIYSLDHASGFYRTQFSVQANPADYKFTIICGNERLKCGTVTLLNKTFRIPYGAVLFDPDSWDEEEQKYTRVSDPAEPLDNSDGGEESKTE